VGYVVWRFPFASADHPVRVVPWRPILTAKIFSFCSSKTGEFFNNSFRSPRMKYGPSADVCGQAHGFGARSTDHTRVSPPIKIGASSTGAICVPGSAELALDRRCMLVNGDQLRAEGLLERGARRRGPLTYYGNRVRSSSTPRSAPMTGLLRKRIDDPTERSHEIHASPRNQQHHAFPPEI